MIKYQYYLCTDEDEALITYSPHAGFLQALCESSWLVAWCHNSDGSPWSIQLPSQSQIFLTQRESPAVCQPAQALPGLVWWRTCRYWPGVWRTSAAGLLVLILPPSSPGHHQSWQQAGGGWSHHCRQGWSGVSGIGIWLCWERNARAVEGGEGAGGTDDASLAELLCWSEPARCWIRTQDQDPWEAQIIRLFISSVLVTLNRVIRT